MGLTPKFDKKVIENQLAAALIKDEPKFINALGYIGEEYVNKARSKTSGEGGFKDVTGNLRSSIGYGVYKDGTRKSGDRPNSQGISAMNEAAANMKGIGVIVAAGMEYAGYVEAKGKDVITGSQPSKRDVTGTLTDLLL